ncbi:DUF368 domain-containing protein [Fodinibius salinus]|uniref:DUF368 domain-containing protein n=1 Tax=Fodinibius salinus TaxID=860790 RepID=UPI001FEAF11F|nr:DUF368 domain-containing protein [Fodinibius salinus]
MKGFLMGSADIVPGVSGGTMALIVGIYTRLINAIKSFDTTFFKRLLTLRFKSALREVDWRFLLVLFCGMIGAVLFFTKVVPLQVYMFTDPELIYGLFFGLIVGSIVILVKAIDGFGWIYGLMIVLGAGIGFWVVTLVPTSTPESPLFVFLSGSVAICAMVLPGISGSYILLILRKYDYILSEVGKVGTPEMGAGLWALLPFVFGAICGLAIFSRILSWLLNRYEAKTLAVLIGFLIGSLYVIWPYQDRSYKEIVSNRSIVEYYSPQAQKLRSNPINKKQPEFTKLGKIISTDSSSQSSQKVEVLTVKQKLIASSPFVPYITRQDAGTSHFWSGIGGMLIGVLMVLGLDRLRGSSSLVN